MIHILYIGTNPEISVVVHRVINANENWEGTVASSVEEAVGLVRQKHFDVILLGCGLDADTENNLKSSLLEINPNLKIVLHYGGGSGLLKAEIESALA